MLDALKEKILGISETKKPEISAVSSILTDSFFDETIENPEAKIFKVLNQDLSKMIIKEEISMAKTSQKCKKMKECMVFLTEEAIFYESVMISTLLPLSI